MSDNEQNNENRETISDILAEMREHNEETTPPYVCFTEDGGIDLSQIIDRIEAAWNRERAKVEADALAVGGIVEATRHKPCNASAKKHRRTKDDDPSKILHDYWRDHYEV